MNINYIEVNIQTLEKDANMFEERLSFVKNDIKTMLESIVELDAMWQGQAKQAFLQQFQLDKNMLEETVEMLEGILDSIREAVSQYKNCENQVSSEIDSLVIN